MNRKIGQDDGTEKTVGKWSGTRNVERMHSVARFVPISIRPAVRYLVCLATDSVHFVLRQGGPLIPPTRLMFDGPPSIRAFKENGEAFLKYYINLCQLRPDEAILDVGCGIGRKSIPLTRYLDQTGHYEGFDAARTGIDWCRDHVSMSYPNFNFQHADVFNGRYNPKGKIRDSQYRFPYESGSFDVAVAASVFTHMLPGGMRNYVSEIARVLRTGGRGLLTFFLRNDESRALLEARKSVLDFRYEMGVFRSTSLKTPEDAVRYDESFVRDLIETYQLAIREPIYYGRWSGRKDFLNFQDIIISRKT